MRDISSWGEQLRKTLRKSDELIADVDEALPNADIKLKRRELSRLAQLITDVELGLTLLREIAPQEPAIAVSAFLLGYRFPLETLENDENWRLVQKARFYLVRRKGKQWERSISEYSDIPAILRIFSLQDINSVPQLIPTSIFPRRLELYRQTLNQTPQPQENKVKLATAGYWYARITHKGNSPVEVPIKIPEAVANIAPVPQISFLQTRQAINPNYTVTREALLEDAQEMDEKLHQAGYDAENYYERLLGIALQLYDADTQDFQSGIEINLEKLIHIVGLLNVGKSTLLEIKIYHFAKRKKRCALLVNDVVAAVRLASLFREGLGIPAAPVLGNSERTRQLKQVFEPLLLNKGEEIEQGATHPAWRWFSPVCPLLALVQSEEKWEFGNEPCHNLYQKITITQQGGEDVNDDDEEEKETEDKYTCPLYYKCPRHQLERDIAEALVWILTPASFIHTPVPRQGFQYKQTFAEAVYHHCDFLFSDEADRIQVQLDEAFAPDEVLLDNSDSSFLNKLGQNIAPIYNSNRLSMTAAWFEAWTNAQYDAQKAINRMCPLLYKQEKLVEWLGEDPFTGRSLFARMIRELVNQPDKENSQILPNNRRTGLTRTQRIATRQQQILPGLTSPQQRQYQRQLMEDLEQFIQAPLSRLRGGELSAIALSLLSAESEKVVFTEIGNWWQKWLEAQNLPQPDESKFEQLKQHTYFAIIVTVLDDRLTFLVDNFGTIHRFLDLHDTSQALVNRPPRDYLPVVPTAPVGNILGFRYRRDRSNNKGGKLEYFRYVGVGRYLLLNFPYLFAVDDWDGPHTVLISGTSYAPGTPAYHIRERPKVLLESARNNQTVGDAGIGESEFFFSTQKNHAGEYIALSGKLPAARKKAAQEMVKAIGSKAGQPKSFLDKLFEKLKEKEQLDPQRWGDRNRLLLLTNSYDEAALVESILKPLYRVENLEGIAVLRRDNAPADLKGIRRSQIRDLKNLPTQIVIAPLMALERGHNILNDRRIAAFGAAVFLSRPMPVPDDWQTTVQQLNDWALQHACESSFYESLLASGETLTLIKAEEIFYRAAIAQMVELNSRPSSFKSLNDRERRVLCSTQLVSIWQVIGRLVRGGVPCIVHFLDVKFAPQSAISEVDKEYTSLLVGILKELQSELEAPGKQPWETTLTRSLYGAFFNTLKNTKELHHDL